MPRPSEEVLAVVGLKGSKPVITQQGSGHKEVNLSTVWELGTTLEELHAFAKEHNSNYVTVIFENDERRPTNVVPGPGSKEN